VLQEGEVGAGDDILKVGDGPEQMTVAEIDALLYLPGHSRERVERALRIQLLARAGKVLSRRFSSKSRVQKPWRETPGLQMKNKCQHGPASDR
jgi:MOSC domain-containing protein YiiM